MASANYTLGRGKIYFDRFTDGTTTKTGERYFGNTTEFNINVTSETLDHFDADQGLRVKDQSVLLEVSRAGSIVSDEISVDNLSLFFLASGGTVTEAGGTITDEQITVQPGLFYQVGLDASNPSGVRNISSVVVGDDATPTTTYVEGTDYNIDLALGRVEIIDGGAIVADQTIFIDYTLDASSREQIVTADVTIEGAMRFVSFNAQGTKRDYYFPYVKMSPSGDFALKGQEWLQLGFDLEVLKLSDTVEAIYIDGRAV